MNPSEGHQPMAMRNLSGTPTMCMAMDTLEQIGCDPTSSGENPSLAAPTCWVLALMIEIIFDTPTEWRP